MPQLRGNEAILGLNNSMDPQPVRWTDDIQR
jgi:hypothetical protein